MTSIPKVKITAHEIKRELRRSLEAKKNGLAPRWAVFEELRLGTGFSRNRYTLDEERDRRESRIDLFAIDCYPSNNHERRAYEIKVDRGDLRNELANPDKRAPWLEIVNKFYIVIPKGLATVGEIKAHAPEVGVIYYSPKVKPDLALCDCGNETERQDWKHSFGCTYKTTLRASIHGRAFDTARAPMKLDGCEPSWGLVASILRRAAA